MRKASVFILVCVTLLIPWTVRAQNDLPPAIIHFLCDRTDATLAEVEAGTTPITFTWQTVGITSEHHLALYQGRLDGWERLDTQVLATTGSFQTMIEHPSNFAPPTYRLTIEDTAGTLLDEWYLTVSYQLVEETAEIVSFTPVLPSVDINQIVGGKTHIDVNWEISNRQPTTGLSFEQLLPDGSAVNAELSRTNQWTASRGTGTLQLIFSSAAQPFQIRLRLVELSDNSQIDEAVISLPITGTLVSTATPVPSSPPPVGTGPKVIRFSVTPNIVNLGDSVTVEWEVTGAASIGVSQTYGDYIIDSAPNAALSGSWTTTVGVYYHPTDTAFILWMRDSAGHDTSQNLSITVRCNYTYFFAERSGRCPSGPSTTVQAAYQPFERGFMIWWGDSKKILVMYADGGTRQYSDLWTGEEIVIADTPPAGLIAPQRGFGKIWMEDSYTRTSLGWATGPEQAYTVTIQDQRVGPEQSRQYFTLPDARIIEIEWGYNGTWKYY
jgi:hypothetical protein